MVRVSGGDKKKAHLKVAKGIRPTRGIVRRSIFDRLGPWIEGKRVLELFAGTGAVGLEALSRGATEVWFVEKSNSVSRVLEENATKLGLKEKVHILKKDVKRGIEILRSVGEKFDLVFADPPYSFRNLEKTLSEVGELLEPHGVFLLEVRKGRDPMAIPRLSLEKEVRFGDTKILWYRCVSG